MAWGISPRKIITIPLGDYSPDYYLTLLYHAFKNLGWRIGYFNRDGIIGYTQISWESYAEEVSARIIGNDIVIKSECVGYQFFFTDYGKNAKNLELLVNGEIEYVEYHLQDSLHETTQQLIDSIPDNQFINLEDPPMGYKEKLRTFLSAFTPAPKYFITPLLVIINIVAFFLTHVIIIALFVASIFNATRHNGNHFEVHDLKETFENLYLSVGFSSRNPVLHGQVWRLVTSIFSHFSLLHLGGNMIVLIYIGSLIESKLGRWNYLILYLLTGICASITSVIWHDHGVAAGASGAIFGLFGILLALLSTKFYEASARRALLISTVIFVAYSIIPIGKEVDHAAHFGGLISGYLFGLLAYSGLKNRKQTIVVGLASIATLAYTACCLAFAPVYQLRDLKELTHHTQKLSNSLQQNFYGNYNMSHDSVMYLLNTKALPEIDTLKDIAPKLNKLTLPKKQKQVAVIKSKLILEECKLYTLLYKEYRDRDPVKYRPEINIATQNINDLRVEWTKTGDDPDLDDDDN
ncbi:rhomboid family intramembrane serine protease [Mucilaginibacter ximonensis]|uniref:Rhomboid family intramembrane serine protease n=1 Tax=Mucilaginibacter ximonensis TaxID=538021 RepID=A0ABW5YEA9_9SPHI